MLRTICKRVWHWASGWARGGPHFVIGDPARPYMRRWYVLPRNPVCNVYVHQVMRDDDDRATHDHPWVSLSLVVRGGYIEQEFDGQRKWYGPGSVIFRRAVFRHRLELPGGAPCWTIFITGPAIRDWGFWCPRGFVPWQEFTAPASPGQVGRGCGEGATR